MHERRGWAAVRTAWGLARRPTDKRLHAWIGSGLAPHVALVNRPGGLRHGSRAHAAADDATLMAAAPSRLLSAPETVDKAPLSLSC